MQLAQNICIVVVVVTLRKNLIFFVQIRPWWVLVYLMCYHKPPEKKKKQRSVYWTSVSGAFFPIFRAAHQQADPCETWLPVSFYKGIKLTAKTVDKDLASYKHWIL